mgnify:CR=1 FL=1
MTARRAYSMALVALAVGGIGLVVAYGLTWATAQVPLLAGADGVGRQVDVTGRDVVPLAAAGGWLAVASVAGVIATRGAARRVVAVVAVVAGLAGVAGALVFAGRSSAMVVEVHDGADAVSATPAWLLAVAAGALVVAAGAWTFARGAGWAVLSARYERRPQKADVSPWQAQDLGLDPTDDQPR